MNEEPSPSPDPGKVAYPVAYMLMRRMPRGEKQRELLRTDIRFGVVNNANRDQITHDGKWMLACVVGPFDNIVQAKAFHDMWRNLGTQNGIAPPDSGTCRGSARMARGVQLATVWEVHPWVDFPVVFGRQLCHYELITDGSHLRAQCKQATE